jgi:hypothetical protein
VWRGGPVFLRDVWYWRHIIVHSVYHTENAVDVKVWRPPERLRIIAVYHNIYTANEQVPHRTDVR